MTLTTRPIISSNKVYAVWEQQWCNGLFGDVAIFLKNEKKPVDLQWIFFALPDQIFLSLSACACGPEEKAYTYQRQRLDTYLLACLFIQHWCQEDIGIFKETLHSILHAFGLFTTIKSSVPTPSLHLIFDGLGLTGSFIAQPSSYNPPITSQK